MDVGKGREHAYRDVGGRATQDAVAEDAEALPGGRLNAQNVNLFLREP